MHLLSQTELTGSEVYAEALARDQAAHGHQIFVVSGSLHLQFPGETLKLEIATGSFWIRMQNIRRLIAFLREKKIDVIHCHSRAACRHAYWASRFTDTPIVTTLHGYQHPSFSKRLFNIYGETVIAVCEKIRDQLCRDFHVDPSSVKVLRNPLAFDWKEAGAERTTISLIGRSSGPKGRRLRALFQSEAKTWLGLDPNLQLELVLPGLFASEKTELMKTIPPALQSRVHIETNYQSLLPVLEKSRVVVASGRIALEGFAAGCEVIALGEARLEGRMNEENLPFQLANNFGDVGPEEVLDPQAVTHELRKILRDPLSARSRGKIRELLESEFSKERICQEIEEIYRAARLWKKAPGLPILMYHKIPAAPIQTKHRIFVTAENFEKHLLFFQSQGFTTLSFDELADFWFDRKSLDEFPEKPLLLTFDDGYRDNLENALPLLEKYRMKANWFLLGDPSINANTWDEDEGAGPAPLMSIEQKRLLAKNSEHAWIGSHGMQHLDLRSLSEDDVLKQMTASKETLEKDLNLKRPACAFAYPYGWIDARLPALAKKAGYDFAVNTDRGALRWVDNRFSLFRVNIFPEESWFSLWRKTSRWYRKRYYKRRKQ